MSVGTLAPQGANRYRQKGNYCLAKTYISVFCKWLKRSGCRGSGFELTVVDIKIKGYKQECCEGGSSTQHNTSMSVTRKYLGKLWYELFEFYHHGVIHCLPIPFLFQQGKLTSCMGIGLCLAHAVLAFHRAVGTHGLYFVLLPICRYK